MNNENCVIRLITPYLVRSFTYRNEQVRADEVSREIMQNFKVRNVHFVGSYYIGISQCTVLIT
jgi:fucose permease